MSGVCFHAIISYDPTIPSSHMNPQGQLVATISMGYDELEHRLRRRSLC